ncbi:hypothetical protein V1512DRAFT_264255 [Lipomyces arxii]|uniref:uncharacterized protein n=1 Tax=Lipomyces arxii TaxID=56418 RepID=UPI0034CF9A49
MPPVFGAKVKAAVSGDTLVLTPIKPPQPGQAPSERVLSLAYLSAPRLRRNEGDELYAFQSREHLRIMLVGKIVQCDVKYTVPNSNREYGVVTLPGDISVNEELILAGTVRVRASTGKNEPNEIVQKYQDLESMAKASGVGLWAPSVESFVSHYDLPPGFADKYKGQQLDAIIEHIINGDRVLARFLLPGEQVQVPLLIAGIRAPRSASTTDPTTDPGEAYGDVAKWYVEARLLQRSVKIDILGESQQGVLIGTIIHPAGNIAEKLLEIGLAHVSDWQTSFVGAANMSKFRMSEQTAKSRGINLWHGVTVHTTPVAGAAGAETDKSFTAVVARIISADTLAVRTKNGDEQIIQLASIRAPRQSDAKQASYVNVSREFVRKKAIGKHVKVVILYTRPKSEQFDARNMATVELPKAGDASGTTDLGALLVENGLAGVIRHRKGDDADRSPIWDELVELEEAAIKGKKGFHSGVPVPPERVVNASESHSRASAFLPSLQRQKRVPAIVEFVNTGSRLRLFLPRDNARIKFIIAGIHTPRVAMNNPAPGVPAEKSEPFGEESREFSARRLMQRDVEIDVTHADRAGGFFGLLRIPGTKDTFAKSLLEEGLATVDEYSAQDAGVLSQLRAAEEEAQAAKKGLWKEDKGKAKAVVAPVAASSTGPKRKEYLNVAVTDVSSDGSFSYVVLGDYVSKLQTLLSTLTATPHAAVTVRPRINDLVAYPLSETKLLGRFKVTNYDHVKKTVSIASIDFGYEVTALALSKLRTLPPQFTPSLSGVPALVKKAKLSLISWPEFQDEYMGDAVDAFYDKVGTAPGTLLSGNPTVKLVAIVDNTLDNLSIVTLYDANDMEASINAKLVADGLVFVTADKILRRSVEQSMLGSPEITELKKRLDEAKRERKGIWEYGDVTPDDE